LTRRGPEIPAGRPPFEANDPVDRIVGIGPRTAAALAAVGVRRVADLLFHLPRRYEDRGQVLAVDEARAGRGPVLLYGRLVVHGARYVRRRLHITDGELADASGRLRVRWFNQPWIAERLDGGVEAFVFGSVGLDRGGRPQLVNPEIEIVPRTDRIDEIVPIYPRLGPLTGKRLRNAIDQALGCLDRLPDPVPDWVRRESALVGLAEALGDLHRPRVPADADRRRRRLAALDAGATEGHRRLAFDELLAVASVVAGTRARRLDQSATPIRVGPGFEQRCRGLFPFELTAAQRRAIGEITADLGRPVPMARLLQGDVGSGKTAVAVVAISAVLASGRQAALMAPTELLAEQLHRSVAAALEPAGARVCLLTGSVPAAVARDHRSRLADGGIEVVVGTHALFQDNVEYADLGLVVIDEQHRFGVAQRQRLLDKGESPHLLVMTATPIPRSLALTLYGDLDLTVIDELPPGRSPVRTEIRGIDARDRILGFLRTEIDAGGQVFIVFPLIEASDKVAAAALEEEEARIRCGLGGLEVGVLHGRLARDERELVAGRFRSGELKAILATTVIEVGVDVPAASVMVVESADRFGLSQLHQLRGRVGRGTRRSWCILVAGDGASEAARRRLAVLARTNDGFEIAEADLEHRGPGEITGRRQWGAEAFRFANLVRHRELVERTRAVARRLAEDGGLDEVRDALLHHHRVGEDFSIG
jgi:ATP-dependent DNA helicase RecG